ncbi:MAG TPA: tetratricopeptide repeat protein [Pyrinomonadaceae bacterium]|jgi:tetratricopeptide (TPR) repeat protein|nr:tetratricopeptide repeat protein [Pyrinomonadaceae bacterium]
MKSYPVNNSLRTLILALAVVLCGATVANAQKMKPQRKQASVSPAAKVSPATKSLLILTEPNTIVWLDEVRHGATDASGQLKLEKVRAGRHTLRVRAEGFKERVLTLAPAERGSINVKLLRTTDEAELLFQRAEAAREQARDEEARRASAELYRQALVKRPRFPAARVGLARVLLDLNDYGGAYDEIDRARALRPVYPEASAVEGRIRRADADYAGAIEAFRRALREARDFQPEAHTGLALVYEEKGQNEEAAAEFRAALSQLSDTEPVIYQLLGALYEKMEKYKEAVAAYEKYLQLAPEGSLAPAVRSILDQLRRQAAEQQTPS